MIEKSLFIFKVAQKEDFIEFPRTHFVDRSSMERENEIEFFCTKCQKDGIYKLKWCTLKVIY